MAHEALQIDLSRRLGEREVVRAHPGLDVVTEHRLSQVIQGALQMRQRDALVNHQALDLMEHRYVGGVELVGAIDLARAHDVDGQLTFQHGAGLHRRGLRPQQHMIEQWFHEQSVRG